MIDSLPQPTHFFVYQTTNRVDGKIYIGKHKTRNIKDGYLGSGKHLKRAINKYGVENFQCDILFRFDSEEEMNAKEAELVTVEFCARKDTYNICIGGRGGFSYINGLNKSISNFNNPVTQQKACEAAKESLQRKTETDPNWRKERASLITSIKLARGTLVGSMKGKHHTEFTRMQMISSNVKSRKVQDDQGRVFPSRSECCRVKNMPVSAIKKLIEVGKYKYVE